MAAEESKDYLDVKALIILFIITLVWGFNHPSIKYVNQGIAPVFASTLRSIIASICGVIYCLRKKEKIFHTDINLLHGAVVGLLFGLEFACIYFGLLYTDAARSIIFLYTSPFIVAIGAHFFSCGGSFNGYKVAGTCCGLRRRFTGLSRETHRGQTHHVHRGHPGNHRRFLLGNDHPLYQKIHGREGPADQYVSLSTRFFDSDSFLREPHPGTPMDYHVESFNCRLYPLSVGNRCLHYLFNLVQADPWLFGQQAFSLHVPDTRFRGPCRHYLS